MTPIRSQTALSTPAPSFVLSADDLELVLERSSINAATCGIDGQPHLMRALGCRMDESGRCTILLGRPQSQAMLDDIAATGQVAVVFARPTTDQSIQLKASDARVEPVRSGDRRLVEDYQSALTAELALIGYPPAFTAALLGCPFEDVVAVSFMPSSAFRQTPGLGAGAALSRSTHTAAPGPGPQAPASEIPGSAEQLPAALPANRHPEPTTAFQSDLRADPASSRPSKPPPADAPRLDDIRHSFEGVTPGLIATCSTSGVPNITYLSQFEYVDSDHIAASFQFFNKTRANLLSSGRATLLVMDPVTAAYHRLVVRHLRTETEGPLFERMRARLSGIASHTGMSGVFRLQGADVYQVKEIETVAGSALPDPRGTKGLLSAIQRVGAALRRCQDLEALWQDALALLASELHIEHSMLLMMDRASQRLFTVASHGYERSGVGSEVPLGIGVIGVAARERVAIRITHVTQESIYTRAVLESALHPAGMAAPNEISLPGLYRTGSQLAMPIEGTDRLLGVLYVESAREMRFTFEDEDALSIMAMQLGLMTQALMQAASGAETSATGEAPFVEAAQGSTIDSNRAPHPEPDRESTGEQANPTARATPLTVKYFDVDHSVFLDADYLIKGVAGAIFRTLVGEFLERHRTDFSNRELRLNPALRLPEVTDNLEARLILLSRRLHERQAGVLIERTGRGRFALRVSRPLRLHDSGSDSSRAVG